MGRRIQALAVFRSPYFEGKEGGRDSSIQGLYTFQASGAILVDSLFFALKKDQSNSLSRGAKFGGIQVRDSLAILEAGRAGFALLSLGVEGTASPLANKTLQFYTLRQGSDTAETDIVCQLASSCAMDTLVSARSESNGKVSPLEADSVSGTVIDNRQADSTFLLIATQAGLRRGLAGGRYFPYVKAFPDGDSLPRITRIKADSALSAIWVFTPTRFYVSTDAGLSFHYPPKVPSVTLDPKEVLSGFTSAPELAFLGDTAFINFKLSPPGLVQFHLDTVLATVGEKGSLSEVILDRPDSLTKHSAGQFTQVTVIKKAEARAMVLGTDGEGLFYRIQQNGKWGPWKQENKLRVVEGSLKEIITFPTLFDGSKDVRLGYKLSKNGKVTITVFNYAMEKVRVIVNGQNRQGGKSRSEESDIDKWDGKDDSGRYVSVGTYYVLVESSAGEKGWGKVLVIRGRD